MRVSVGETGIKAGLWWESQPSTAKLPTICEGALLTTIRNDGTVAVVLFFKFARLKHEFKNALGIDSPSWSTTFPSLSPSS